MTEPAGSAPITNAPSIPVPTANNLMSVLNAIRNWIIATSNRDAGRANNQGTVHSAASPTPSQFAVTASQFVSVTFTDNGGHTVVIPVLSTLTFTNPVTAETIIYTAPKAAFSGGVVGAAI